MSKLSNVAFLGGFAVGLGGAGAWILAQPSFDLSARNPEKIIHLHGLPQLLFAAGPIMAGVAMILAASRVWRGGELRPDAVTASETVCFLLGIGCLIFGIVTGERLPRTGF
jgi:hypothetical protein